MTSASAVPLRSSGASRLVHLRGRVYADDSEGTLRSSCGSPSARGEIPVVLVRSHGTWRGRRDNARVGGPCRGAACNGRGLSWCGTCVCHVLGPQWPTARMLRWGGQTIRWGAPLETIGEMTRSLREISRPGPIAYWSQGAHAGWDRYGGRSRTSPTPDELRLQAYHALSSRITSLYWFNLALYQTSRDRRAQENTQIVSQQPQTHLPILALVPAGPQRRAQVAFEHAEDGFPPATADQKGPWGSGTSSACASGREPDAVDRRRGDDPDPGWE